PLASIGSDDQTITDFSYDDATNVLTITLEDGNTSTVNLENLSSTVTQTVTTGNTIATHTSGTSTTTILETITAVAQATGNADADVTAGDANTIATYTDENGDDVTVNETVTAFSQNDTPTSSDPNATGEISYTNENGTTTTAQVVSSDADNNIQVGSDGGAFFAGPTIAAAGNVAGDGGTISSFGTSNIVRIDTGDYRINFVTPITGAYVVQLTVLDCDGNCPPAGGSNYDDPGISYYGIDANGFNVNIGDSDNGTSPKVDIDLEFMFTVIKLP
ncbi:hypothetical protein, partial [Nonlabens ulvanivorans]